MMGRNAAGLVGAALAIAALAGAAAVQAGQDSAKGKLAVTMEYKGPGTVNKEHRIWIWVFDNPNISADSTPVATEVVSENSGVAKFVGLPEEVYIAAAYDEKGGYDGTMGPPPPGTPIVIYGMATSGAATPVKTGGDAAAVTVTFDGSTRMP